MKNEDIRKAVEAYEGIGDLLDSIKGIDGSNGLIARIADVWRVTELVVRAVEEQSDTNTSDEKLNAAVETLDALCEFDNFWLELADGILFKMLISATVHVMNSREEW